MNSFLKTFLACLLAVVASSIISFFLFVALLTGLASFGSSQTEYKVSKGSILTLDLSIPLIEKPVTSPMEMIDLNTFKIKQSITLRDAIAAVQKAAIDPNIDGILLKLPMSIPSSMASLYELRQALAEFRGSEKFIISYGEVYSQGGYYLASVSDKIYMYPAGGLEWSGLSSSVMFYKGALDKLGVQAEIIRHGKFKGAVEPFMREDLSPENRLQIESMTSSIWDYMVAEIARSRSIEPKLLDSYATNLTIDTPEKAVELGLVDSLMYKDEVNAELSYLTGKDKPAMVTLSQYKSTGFSNNGDVLSKNKIAIVYAEGGIVDSGDVSKEIVGEKLAKTIAGIRADSSVKAVVLRVNSPGGSALASDVIWHEVELTRKIKPVVVSMNSYAASGGYYIAAAADRIVTSPVTLTGSIGVFGVLFNAEKGAKDLLGITVDIVNTNPSASVGNPFHQITPAEKVYIQNGVDRVYTRFAGLVAEGRHMDYASVDSIGQGRVWTGLQAVENKLADRTGTLNDAIALAAELSSVQDYRIKSYPEEDTSLGSLFMAMSEATATRIMGQSKPIIDQMDKIQKLVNRQGIRADMPYDVTIHF